MSYQYWNNFIESWKSRSIGELQNMETFEGWSNPYKVPLMNSSCPGDHSLYYLPEPWWGNSGADPLHAVVINYNPGKGCHIQHHEQSTNLFDHPTYADFVENDIRFNQYFTHTSRWHKTKRAACVFKSLERLGTHLNGNNQLSNFLSIELVPWHTTSIKEIDQYIHTNIVQIFNHSFRFAAERSTLIQNTRLLNKVIVRINGRKMLTLLEQIRCSHCSAYSIKGDIRYTPVGGTGFNTNGAGGTLKFRFDEIPAVEFICIWGTKSRNDFPPAVEMDHILQKHI